jgi:hypothetical protein
MSVMDKAVSQLKAAAIGIQGTALFLVVFGSAATALGCWKNWAELKTLGAGVAGAGIQAITTQVHNSLINKDGGTVNLQDTPVA